MDSWMGRLVVGLHMLLFHFAFSHSLCHPHQGSALLQFMSSFIIDYNIYYDDYPPYDYYGSGCHGAPPKTTTWENGTDCCSWLGVTCDTISGHVTGLDLSCGGLRGEINPNSTLFRLLHLRSLNLALNYVYFSPLLSQFGRFPSLTHLNLSSTFFEGEIPSQLAQLSKLTSLDLSWNSLVWERRTWKRLLQNATSLTELVLDGTEFGSIKIRSLNFSSSLVTISLSSVGLTGNLANNIPCLPNLQHLYLSENYGLEGQLPNLSCSAASLSILHLYGCQFQGSIPPSFSNLTYLTSLDLSQNYLSGSIPPFSNLTPLTSLDLSENYLKGSIPPSLLTLPRLSFMSLSDNFLSGQIPNVFHQSNTFQRLHLGENYIGGELPSSLANLQHLNLLDLSQNKFHGQIPNVFAGITKLETLHLGYNNLQGQIPSSLFGLTHLSHLDCSYNKFEGPLSNKITGFPNLTQLYFNDNLLNGTIPSWCLSLPTLVNLDLSSNQFTGRIGAISSFSLEYLDLCGNKLQGNIPKSIFSLVNLTNLCLSLNNLSAPVHFPLFSKLRNLESLSLSHSSQLSLNFTSNVNYSFHSLHTLELSSICLTEFPKLSGKLPNLSYLDLSNNRLTGRVPNWLIKTGSLLYLYLSGNLLTSSLDQYSWENQLTVLDLSFNLLAGDIPGSICTSSLEMLNLSHNKLTGIIPECLTNSPTLSVLDLQMNKFCGTLPTTFTENNVLSTLNLNANQFEGLLPESLSNCTYLEVLNLANNQIKDIFPHWLQTLPNLEVLILRANKLHGPIFSLKTKHPFSSLIIFDISSNNFSGPIPEAFIKSFKSMKNIIQDEMGTSLQYLEEYLVNAAYIDSVTVTLKANPMILVKIPTNFVYFDLSKNKFEGEIPDVIGELHAIKLLNLSHNILNGSIPRSLGNLTNLESLDLSSNILTGKIPIELVNLNYLEVLNLSQNCLVGEIPQGKQFYTFSNDSYEGNLGLCGLPLSATCSKNHEKSSPPLPTLQHEQNFGFGWKPVAIGYGCGIVFGMGIGCCVLLIGKPQWLVKIVGVQPSRRFKSLTRMRTHENCDLNN